MRSLLSFSVASLAALALLLGGSMGRATAVERATAATAAAQSDETLTVEKAGDGSGTVVSRPVGITCGSTCSHAFPYGTVVHLGGGEDEDTNSVFSGWSGACSGTDMCQVTMDAPKSVTATFVLETDTGETTTTTTTTTSAGSRGGSAPSCVVPKLKDRTLTAARTAIAKAHCSLGKVTKAFSAKVKKNRVISQKPAAGKKVAKGSKVNLVVSRGEKRS